MKNNVKMKSAVLTLAFGLAVFAGMTFIIGVIDGYVRPLKCN